MSDLDKMRTVKEVKAFAEKLIETTVLLQVELQQTKDKLIHLEQITKFNVSPIAVASSEEELCRIEIKRLYDAAKQGPLEFQEIKAFEIYVKSLMLIRGKTSESDKKTPKKEEKFSQDQLLQFALQDDNDPTEQ